MSTFKRTIVGALMAAFLPFSGAHAGGDFRFPPEPVVAVPSAYPIAEYPAWYLRGDIGWSFYEDFDLDQNGTSLSDGGIEDIFSIGGGLGYIFSDNVRGDVTVEHRFDAELEGRNNTANTRFATDLSSTVLLGNLYYDVRGREDFTPYIGGGLGMAFNETSIGDEYRTEFAAAAMAGISYRMRDNVLLDAGYRFLYLGEARTDTAVPTAIEDIVEHEIRVGVRYEFQ